MKLITPILLVAAMTTFVEIKMTPKAIPQNTTEDGVVFAFDGNARTIEESSRPQNGRDSFWWLDSGGELTIADGKAKTLTGSLTSYASWAKLYDQSNPLDTDFGHRPQNIFRLISKKRYENVQQEIQFNILKTNLSDSPARNKSNGLLLFARYLDSDNFYCAGVRVDGTAVIKKKYQGAYFTMATMPVINDSVYDIKHNPNLLTARNPITIKFSAINKNDTIDLKLFLFDKKTNDWVLALGTKDDGQQFGNKNFKTGFVGIRTDFMDVEFSNYKIDTN